MRLVASPAAEGCGLPRGRIPELDGVRGLAVLMVLVLHYFSHQALSAEEGSLLWRASMWTSQLWCGVDLFFVLSGFLIGGLLLDRQGDRGYFAVFYGRRACRILPVYVLLLAVFYLSMALPWPENEATAFLYADPMPWWSYLTFTQNVAMGIDGSYGANFVAASWSLAVEEQFYLLAPVVVLLLPRRWLVAGVVAGILAAPLLRAVSDGFYAWVNTPWRMDALLMGVLLAQLVRHEGWVRSVRRHRPAMYLALLVGVAGCVVMIRHPNAFGALKHTWYAGTFATLMLAVLVDPRTPIGWFFRSPVLIWLGAISYGLYMIHQPVAGAVHAWLGDGRAPHLLTTRAVGLTLMSLVLSLSLATISRYTYEAWFLRLGKRLRYGDPASDALEMDPPAEQRRAA